jgi:hypothetical protein
VSAGPLLLIGSLSTGEFCEPTSGRSVSDIDLVGVVGNDLDFNALCGLRNRLSREASGAMAVLPFSAAGSRFRRVCEWSAFRDYLAVNGYDIESQATELVPSVGRSIDLRSAPASAIPRDAHCVCLQLECLWSELRALANWSDRVPTSAEVSRHIAKACLKYLTLLLNSHGLSPLTDRERIGVAGKIGLTWAGDIPWSKILACKLGVMSVDPSDLAPSWEALLLETCELLYRIALRLTVSEIVHALRYWGDPQSPNGLSISLPRFGESLQALIQAWMRGYLATPRNSGKALILSGIPEFEFVPMNPKQLVNSLARYRGERSSLSRRDWGTV